MNISEWLKQNNKKKVDLARIIKKHPVRVHRIINEKSKPDDEEMLLIFQATNGEVTANDFYSLPPKANISKSKHKPSSNINKT